MKINWLIKICTLSVALILLAGNTALANSSGTVNGTNVNIRSGASTSSTVLCKKNTGDKVTIISKEGDWYKIQLSDNSIAYIYAKYVTEDVVVTATSTGTDSQETPPAVVEPTPAPTATPTPDVKTVGYVTVNILNMRSSMSLDNDQNIIKKLNAGNQVTILSTEGDWYKVTTSDNVTGYVYKSYIQIITTPTTDGSVSDIRTKIVSYAMQFIGTPYVYGGTSLTSGVDCSGFTQQIMKAFNYYINRSSYLQSQNGVAVTASELLPGDLVFYGYSGSISHVGMYIGDGKIVHANTSSTGVVVSGMYDSGNKPLICCRRIIA